MNLGGKYVMLEVPQNVNNILAHPWMRKLIIFSIAFVATRNIKTSLLLSLLFILLNHYLLNEQSKSCLITPVKPQIFQSKEKKP